MWAQDPRFSVFIHDLELPGVTDSSWRASSCYLAQYSSPTALGSSRILFLDNACFVVCSLFLVFSRWPSSTAFHPGCFFWIFYKDFLHAFLRYSPLACHRVLGFYRSSCQTLLEAQWVYQAILLYPVVMVLKILSLNGQGLMHPAKCYSMWEEARKSQARKLTSSLLPPLTATIKTSHTSSWPAFPLRKMECF